MDRPVEIDQEEAICPVCKDAYVVRFGCFRCEQERRRSNGKQEKIRDFNRNYPNPTRIVDANFSPDRWVVNNNPDYERASDIVRLWTEHVIDQREPIGCNFSLIGPVGTGKSYLAGAAANAFRAAGMRVVFVREVDILMTLQASFNQDNQNDQELMDDLIQCDVLICDDIGKARQTPWTKEILFSIFDARYSELRATMVTSNVSVSELGGDHQWAAILSRLQEKETGRVVVMKANNLRRQDKQ